MSVADLLERLKSKGSAVVEVKNEGTPLQSVTTFSQDFINPPPLDVPDLLPTIIPKAIEAAPTKRGRPKKEKPMVDLLIEEAEKLNMYPAPELKAEVVGKGFTLFIDCVPDTHTQDMAFIFSTAKKAVAEKAGVPDYRLIEFGQGPGFLALAVEDLIDAGSLSGNVFVSTACQETMACLSLLVSRASSVTRAVR